jgi:2-dehydro-3-deoxygluconokinase
MNTVITFGEVLMRLSAVADERFSQASNFMITYGGSEANISAALAQWKIASAHITCLPSHDIGQAAATHLKKFGVDMQHAHFADGRIGLYFLEPGVSVRSPKIIYDRFDSVFAKQGVDEFDWDTIFSKAKWFHWSGITPAISLSAAHSLQKAIDVAKAKGITISGDINYRRNLWQYGKTPLQIMPDLMSKTDVIIGGVEDFNNCAGISAPDFQTGCELVVKKFPSVKKIATTVRQTEHASLQQISAILYSERGTFSSRQYDLNPIVDRIGAGDAFMAGMIYSFLNGRSDQEAIDFGTASCAFKHTIPGDILQSSVKDIEDLVDARNIGKLLR